MKRTFIQPIKIATLILCGVLGLGSLFPMKVKAATYVNDLVEVSDELRSKGITLEKFVSPWEASNSNWRFGRTRDYNGNPIEKPAMAIGTKFAPTKEGYYRANDEQPLGTIVSFENYWRNNTAEYALKEVTTGYHYYAYEVPDGTILPIMKYESIYSWNTVHKEAHDVRDYPVGSNYGLINPGRWGAWALYNGIEFHSAEQKVPIAAPNEQRSPCFNFRDNIWFKAETTWKAYCALCGENVLYIPEIGHWLFEAPIGAIEKLPVMRQGQELFCYCAVCGGMENTYTIHHTCKAISVNRYHVKYDIGTNDPDASGRTASGTWYYNKASEYERNPVTKQTNYVAKNGFVRPGYEFLGWSTTKGGSVEFIEGDNILLLQESPKLNLNENDATITLYAVWGATSKTLQIDANRGNTLHGTGLYEGETVKSIDGTYQIDRPVGGDNLTLDNAGNFEKDTYLIEANKITLPTGHSLTLDAKDGFVLPNGEQSITLTAPVSCIGISSESSVIVNGKLGEAVYEGGVFKNILYTYGSGTETDKLVLAYEEGAIKLPSAKKPGEAFVGWFDDNGTPDDPSDDTYIGEPGDGIYIGEDSHLYAKYAKMDISITDVYYKENIPGKNYLHEFDNVAKLADGRADNAEVSRNNPGNSNAVQRETGAVNISMDIMTAPSFKAAYKTYYKPSELANIPANWIQFDINSGVGGVNSVDYGKVFTTPGKDQTFTIQSTGYYKLDAFGGEGQNYNATYVGGKGGKTSGIYYLEKDDVIKVQVGGKGDTSTGGGTGSSKSAANLALNGGGYSKVSLIRNGTETVLMIAGGGGAATNLGNGEVGGLASCNGVGNSILGNTSTLISGQTPSLLGNTGESGNYGGGGGYVGGRKGNQIPHTHTSQPSWNGSYTGQISGCWIWTAGGTHYGYAFDCHHYDHWGVVNGHCQQGCEQGTPSWDYNDRCDYCGVADSPHTNVYYKCRDCGQNLGTVSSHTHPASWTLNCSKTIDGYYPSYGGSNFINAAAGLTNTTKSIAGVYAENNGNGKVVVTPVSVGLTGVNTNYQELIGISAPDKTAPSKIENYHIDNNAAVGKTVISVEAPKSNGSNYDFYVELYDMSGATYNETTGKMEGMVLNQTSDIVTKKIESAIAGYYYVLDNAAVLNVRDYIGVYNIYRWDNYDASLGSYRYTWSAHHYMDGNKVWFVPKGSSAMTDIVVDNMSYRYVHIAAVDVAGNIGESESFEIKTTPVTKIVFHTNKLEYQINPETTVSYKNPDNTMEKIPATGENKQGYYLSAYYSIDGSSLVGDTGYFEDRNALEYGKSFPKVTATGCSFVGWNDKKDGSGTWYSQNGTGDGSSPNHPKEFVAASYFGERKEDQTVTLYAIWRDETEASIHATYQTPVINDITGNVGISSPVTVQNGTLPWTKEVLIEVNGKDSATGIYALVQKTDRGDVLTYYVGGDTEKLPQKNPTIYDYVINSAINKEYTATGSIDKEDVSLYSDGTYNLGVLYQKEGTYTITGTAVSREYHTEVSGWQVTNTMQQNTQGYPARKDTAGITVKIDRTAPEIISVDITQKTLNNYTIEELKSFEKTGIPVNEFSTTITVKAKDLGTPDKCSGIKEVYLVLQDAKGEETPKYVKLPLVDDKYTATFNLYTDFPNISEISYAIYAVDYAGNVSERKGALSGGGNDTGVLKNYSVKTAIYNTASEEFNVDPSTGATYFQLGDIGRVEVWTIGYVEGISFDFGSIGDEMVKEIEYSGIDSIYNMGTDITGWERHIPYSVATEIPSTYPRNDKGLSFATHYQIQGFAGNGVSVLMPPLYKLTPNGKTNADGTPQFKWEKHSYTVTGYKNGSGVSAKNYYIFWDTRANDVHYRVTHE